MARRTTKIPSSWKNCATCTHWCGWNTADVFGMFVEFEVGSSGRCNGGAHGLEMPAMGTCPQWNRRF